MTTVRISYDPDLSVIGSTREVAPDEARRLVRRGRAVIVRAASGPVAFDRELGEASDVAVDAGMSLDLDEG